MIVEALSFWIMGKINFRSVKPCANNRKGIQVWSQDALSRISGQTSQLLLATLGILFLLKPYQVIRKHKIMLVKK